MKKNVVVLTMAMILVLALAGCGSKKEGHTDITGKSEGIESTMTVLAYYDNLEIAASEIEPTEEDMAYQENVAYSKILQDVEGKTVVEEGDIANINYKGLLDGVAFEGGTAENYSLMIGSGTFIDGFEEQLVGAEVGGSYELELTFPKDYQSEDLAGKEVIFEVTVNKIQELVEPDEEYILDQIRQSKLRQTILLKLVEGSEFKMDKGEVQEMYDSMLEQYEYYASAGGGLEKYLEFVGQTRKEFDEMLKQDVNRSIQGTLLMDEIARREGLATEEEITAGVVADGTLLDEVVLEFLTEKTTVK